MILIHIILGLLKIIGILLLLLLSLLFFVLLSVLFVPVRYQAYGYRDSEVSKGTVRVSWLARLISCKASYDSQEKKTKWSVKIFGISIQKVMAWKKKRKKTKRNTKQKNAQTKELKIKETKTKELQQIEENRGKESPSKETETVLKSKEIQEKIEQEPNQDIVKSEQKVKKAKKIEQKSEKVERIEAEADKKENAEKPSPIGLFLKKLRKILEIPKKILQKLKKIRITVRGICDKISEIRTFLESEVFLNAKTLLFGEVKKLGIHIFPRKVQGEIAFGFDDPSFTGRVLAVAGLCYPLYGNSIKITPYFDRKILEGEIKLKGRIRGIVLLKSALKVGFNHEIREIWKNFKK